MMRTILLSKNGFTLIETIMVMVIVAILAVAIVVRNPFDAIKLRSAARKVAGDIRYVQKLSISNQTGAGIEFNVNGYSVYRDMTGVAPYPAAQSPGDPCSTGPSNNFIVAFNDPRCSNYSGITITIITLPSSIVKFDSLGAPYGGDNNPLASGSNTITLSHPSAGTQQITITTGTGRVSIP